MASRSVEAYWTFTSDRFGESVVLPDGRCDLIFQDNIDEAGPPIPILTGPATQPYTVSFQPGDRWRGIRLRPHHAILPWAHQIANAADAVLSGDAAVSQVPKLGAFPDVPITFDTMKAVIEPISMGVQNIRLTKALHALHASGGRMRVSKLATHVGWTSRHLNRVFQAHVGLSLKIYAQLVQFHRALKLIQNQGLQISDAAYESGYADHAHLTRAFQRFGGFSPSQIPTALSLPGLVT